LLTPFASANVQNWDWLKGWLRQVQTLKLKSLKLDAVHNFVNVHSVTLFMCNNIRDVTALGSVYTLGVNCSSVVSENLNFNVH
jgi:hypothetical protein